MKPYPVASFLEQIEARLRRAGVVQQQDEPLEELTRRLASSTHRLAPAVHAATAAYLAARFGGRPLSSEQRQRLLSALTLPPSR